MNNSKSSFSSYFKQLQENYFPKENPKKGEHSKGTLYIIASLFTVAFFGFFAINPTFSTISGLQKQLEDTAQYEKDLKQKIENINQLHNEYAEKESVLNLATKAIPFSPELPILTRKIETLAAGSSVEVGRLTFGSVELYPSNRKAPNLYVTSYNLSIGGTKEDIDKFITNFISFDRLVTVDSINQETKDTQKQSVSLNGKIYFNR